MIIDEVSRLQIGQSREDGYINITKMAQASRRLVADYLRLGTTEAFLKQLSANTGILVNQLILVKKGGNAKSLQGTWVHPAILPEFERWLDTRKGQKLRGDKEKLIRDALWQQLGGCREVLTAAGYIDLLTDTLLIEVKLVKRWKEAVGQVLVYGQDYPNHQRRIHLFGKASLFDTQIICQYCGALGIEVTWEK